MMDAHSKIQSGHRKRNAYLYIRQSTPRTGTRASREYAAPVWAAATGAAAGLVRRTDRYHRHRSRPFRSLRCGPRRLSAAGD